MSNLNKPCQHILGGDMALAFVEHLDGRKFAQFVRGIIEIPEVDNSEDDPFAAFHGLV